MHRPDLAAGALRVRFYRPGPLKISQRKLPLESHRELSMNAFWMPQAEFLGVYLPGFIHSHEYKSRAGDTTVALVTVNEVIDTFT